MLDFLAIVLILLFVVAVVDIAFLLVIVFLYCLDKLRDRKYLPTNTYMSDDVHLYETRTYEELL